jgi:hypothetical protein
MREKQVIKKIETRMEMCPQSGVKYPVDIEVKEVIPQRTEPDSVSIEKMTKDGISLSRGARAALSLVPSFRENPVKDK